MQRYSAANCAGGFSNTAVGGVSARDSVRTDSTFSSSNFSLSSRRQLQLLAAYKLKCEKEALNCRLGPPDFYPQSPNCPEETLTRECLLAGYKETVEGIEESREVILSQIQSLKTNILKHKEAIKKRLRAINESRTQKRKAGQVYGVPLSGQLLLKPGLFPEQRQLGDDARKKWIEGLSQQHKHLQSLADHVPHGYRKKSLLEVLVRYNVPLLRATWFIKVNYLNQVQPSSSGVSTGTPDKAQFARTELWTKDLIEYLQLLLDEYLSKNGFYVPGCVKDHTSENHLSGFPDQRDDLFQADCNGREFSLQFKWEYSLRLVQWHYAEGLISPSLILEWVLVQLQDKDSVDILEFVLPIIVGLLESIALSQTYVRVFVDMATRFLNCLYQGDMHPVKPHLGSALVELLRYLLLAAPDAFVALDCFPLPQSVAPNIMNGKGLLPKTPWLAGKVNPQSQDTYCCYLSFGHVMSTLWRRSSILAKIANVNLQGHGIAKVVQALDKALIHGDTRHAYNSLFEEASDIAVDESWIAEVSPCLRSSLNWIGSISSSEIYAIFFLCEWATCDFRDFRDFVPHDIKFTGRKDFCHVYVAILLLKYWMEEMNNSTQAKKKGSSGHGKPVKVALSNDGLSGEANTENISCSKISDEKSTSDFFQSPGPLHDIIVCWLDQHDFSKGEGFRRIQVLIMEFIRRGLFYPQAYVRQLIVSGIMDGTGNLTCLERQRRHSRILKQLPGAFLLEVLEESKIAETKQLHDIVHMYANERNLVLHGFCSWHTIHTVKGQNDSLNFDTRHLKDKLSLPEDGFPPSFLDSNGGPSVGFDRISSGKLKSRSQVGQLKASISALLHLPDSLLSTIETEPDISQGCLRRRAASLESKLDTGEIKPDAEEYTRAKRRKTSNESISHIQGFSSNQSNDDCWWVKKGTKSLDSFKAEHFMSAKHTSRETQKLVRKTQSLAQLQAARIESSQGASTSHVCNDKSNCSHHKSVIGGDASKLVDGLPMLNVSDIGRTLKSLRWLEKRSIVIWLLKSLRLLIKKNEHSCSKLSHSSVPFSPQVEEISDLQWKLGEGELTSILYLVDISSDLYSLVKFLVWLLPKILKGTSDIHLGRNTTVGSSNKENLIVNVGESFILSALQRYENVFVATDLLPEVLSTVMEHALSLVASNGRASSSMSFVYARNLLKKYGTAFNVANWEKGFKATCDPRLLAEIDNGRLLGGDVYTFGAPSGVEDLDDYFRQKISGRIPRAGPIMKEIVQRNVEDAVLQFYGKDRIFLPASSNFKGKCLETYGEGYQIAKKIVVSLLDCMRQNCGASQDADPSLVAASVSAIISNVGPAVAKLPDFPSACSSQSSTCSPNSLSCIQGIVNIHIACLCLLKEALGERLSQVFEISLAVEASSYISGAFASRMVQRTQFQLSPDTHDTSANISKDILTNPSRVFSPRDSRTAAAISALIIGAIVHGVSTLGRMITVFKLKEGLDILQFIRSPRINSNGISRSAANFKSDHRIEVIAHWFQLLVGNCRSLFDGLIVDILGESRALALFRMQRMLPLNLVIPPAYSIFTIVTWRPYIVTQNMASREDIQLYQYLSVAIGDTIKHQPFRDLCLRDTHSLHDLISSDNSDCEFASMLELQNQGLDKHSRTVAFCPLRGRLFFDAILDSSMPSFTAIKDDASWTSGHAETRNSQNEKKISDQIVHVLDTLQPAKIHWQWLELRLLLNEQALMEKIEHSTSIVEALRSFSTAVQNGSLFENENDFPQIVLTRLLVRPDAASLYSEVFHLLGKSLEEKLLLQAKWLLVGNDVLLGRKSIRQRLINVAQSRGLSTKPQFWRPWGWTTCSSDMSGTKTGKWKLDSISLEEGEVVEEGSEDKRIKKSTIQTFGAKGLDFTQQCVTNNALAELVLCCIDRCSNEARTTFATDLIKQLSTIYQNISAATRGASKGTGIPPSGDTSGNNKGNTRKGIRGGSPGIGRRQTGAKDSAPPSAVALKASIWLRLQFLLRLFPTLYPDREPSPKLRGTLASVLLHLLGTPLVYEDREILPVPLQRTSQRKEPEFSDAPIGNSLYASGESLFDMILSVLHGLLSGSKPSWLRCKSSRVQTKSSRDFLAYDRELAEKLQADLDRMQLSPNIRRRLQSAMPMLSLPHVFISCHPPIAPFATLSAMHPAILTGGLNPTNPNSPHRTINSMRPVTSVSIRSKQLPFQDTDMEIDPWTLLEDGATSTLASSNISNVGGSSSEHSNLKAAYCLKGAVRMRRTDLTYIGAIDDGS